MSSKAQSAKKRWLETEIDEYLPELPEILVHVGPKHPAWQKRVKLEKVIFDRYKQYLRERGIPLWIDIMPSPDPEDRGLVWEGEVWVPQNIRIRFHLLILMPSNYPLVPPRAFLDKSVVKYAKTKIYVGGHLERNGVEYVMICHDHMKEIENIWKPTYTLAHFVIHEIWYWWNALLPEIEKNWMEEHSK